MRGNYMKEKEVVPAHVVKFMIEYMIKVSVVEKATKNRSFKIAY